MISVKSFQFVFSVLTGTALAVAAHAADDAPRATVVETGLGSFQKVEPVMTEAPALKGKKVALVDNPADDPLHKTIDQADKPKTITIAKDATSGRFQNQTDERFIEHTRIPKVLSESDVALYKRMFRLQRRLRRQDVVDLLPKLEDNILMGHLIAERLLHAKTRSSYSDLQSWLADYADQGPAPTIYRLANSRKPRGQSHVRPASMNPSVARYSDENSKSARKNDAQADARTRSRLLRQMQRYRTRGDYTRAITLFNRVSTQRAIGTDTWARAGMKLARTLLNDGKFEHAADVAHAIVAKAPDHQAEGLWLGGFARYRLGQYEEAARQFRRLVYSISPNSRYYAQGAWWAARTYDRLKRGSMSRVFLNMAANDRFSYYGQLAAARLGSDGTVAWSEPIIREKDQRELFKDKGIRRVIALVQIGEHALAQQELKAAYERIPYDADESLLALSIQLNLPNTSMTLARNLLDRNRIFAAGMYPTPDMWQPRGGYKIDKALIYAIMRQESAFNPDVTSRAGARGLMQVMPGTARFVRAQQGKRYTPISMLSDPEFNLTLAHDYLLHLEEELDGNLVYMIAAYNAGPGNVRKWIAKNAPAASDPVLFIESIPFHETRHYVMRVMGNLWMYRKRYSKEMPALEAMARNRWPVRAVRTSAIEKDDKVSMVQKSEI